MGALSCPEGYYFTDYVNDGVVTPDDSRFLRSYSAQDPGTTRIFFKFDDPTQGANKLEVAVRSRHDTSAPSWLADLSLISPDPGSQTLTGSVTGSFETIVGAKMTGPWTQVNLAGLRLGLTENVTLSTLDLSGVEVRLYDAGDVLLETIYPNEVVVEAENFFRQPDLATAPAGTQWVDRTSNTYWTPNSGFSWNAGGWWDTLVLGPPAELSAIGKSWNDNLQPLAMRITHDASPTGDLSGLASGVRYGRRLTYTSLAIIDFAEVDLWAQDMEVISWTSHPSGQKVTKIEVLECIVPTTTTTTTAPTTTTT